MAKKKIFPVKPVIVTNKSDLVDAILHQEKVIYVTGAYYKECKKGLKKLVSADNEKIKQMEIEKQAKEREEAYEKNLQGKGHSVFEKIVTVVLFPVAVILFPFGVFKDNVQKELKHYKLKNNKIYSRFELKRTSGNGAFNDSVDYII